MKLPYANDGEHSWERSAASHLERGLQRGTFSVVQKMTRTLTARDSSSTCKPGDNSGVCQKWTSDTNSQTLPIVLGAVIPITCALVVFVYLHRRNKKKQAIEDANDPHKSLDFGTDFAGATQPRNKRGLMGRKDVPEMTVTDLSRGPARNQRGLSMDIMGSPYLLPAGLQGSRESIHSMSRSVQDEHDPYRPVALIRTSTDTSRSPHRHVENGSIYSASTVQTGNEKLGLVANARPMSQSYPKRGDSMPSSSPSDEYPMRELHSAVRGNPPPRKASAGSPSPDVPSIIEPGPPRPVPQKQTLPPAQAVFTEEPEQMAPLDSRSSTTLPPPRKASLAASKLPPVDTRASDGSFYGNDLPPPPLPPTVIEPADEEPALKGRFSIDTPAPSRQLDVDANRMSILAENRMSFMGLRPLPMEDPQEDPESRANRIRSFYKEYFDDSRPMPPNAFYEDYDPAYLDQAAYDYNSGNYAYPQAPFAQPIGRRAMTPPPRGAAQSAGPEHSRHFSTMSGGRGPPRGRPAQRPAPKKNIPPPKALTSLPTPHKLQEDTALIHNPIDFAPPASFRELQNGRRPDSPLGIQRPYSPSVKAYSPLVPAFDELPAMPSPHALRKSGTFTSLDFAQFPRFRGQEGTASDAGSIRSARSGISRIQMDAVRAGAYRVSKIPKEMVTTRDDLRSQLRPKMDLISPA